MRSVLFLLEKKLAQERKDLVLYQSNANSDNPIDKKWGEGNVGSCGTRISELEIAIKAIGEIKMERTPKAAPVIEKESIRIE